MKKLLSVFLILAMLCGLCVPCFAQDAQSEKPTPLIVLSGFARAPLSVDGQTVYPPTTEPILNAVKEIAFPLVRVIADRNWDRFCERLFPAAMSVFEPCRCDENGDSVYAVTYTQYPLSAGNYPDFYLSSDKDEMALVHAAVDAFGVENVYFFSFDWRLDPLDEAAKLRDMVQSVKAQTGSDNVSLAACSMGGNIAMAYLYLYGAEDIRVCLLDNASFLGITMVGELFCGELTLDADSLVDYLLQFVTDNTALKRVLGFVLKHTPMVKRLARFANALLDGVNERLCAQFLAPLFGQMPGMWSFVGDREYAQAKANLLDSEKHATLIERIDRYHYVVQCRAQAILKEAIADGCIVEIVANYGKLAVPITPSKSVCNDYLVDTSLSSGGAVCTENGVTLPQDYVQRGDCEHNHISPDRRIDASTCMFPEYTWLVRDMGHIDFPYGSQGADFLIWLLSAEEQPDIFADARYPQFMTYSVKEKTLTGLN